VDNLSAAVRLFIFTFFQTLMAQPALPSEVWRARLQSTDPFSPPRIAHVASAGASPQPLPRHSSQPNAQKPLKTHIGG